jgi:hypothetical protein
VFFTDGENHFTPLTGVMGAGERCRVPPHLVEALVTLLLSEALTP